MKQAGAGEKNDLWDTQSLRVSSSQSDLRLKQQETELKRRGSMLFSVAPCPLCSVGGRLVTHF